MAANLTYLQVFAASFEPIDRLTPDFHQIELMLCIKLLKQMLVKKQNGGELDLHTYYCKYIGHVAFFEGTD